MTAEAFRSIWAKAKAKAKGGGALIYAAGALFGNKVAGKCLLCIANCGEGHINGMNTHLHDGHAKAYEDLSKLYGGPDHGRRQRESPAVSGGSPGIRTIPRLELIIQIDDHAFPSIARAIAAGSKLSGTLLNANTDESSANRAVNVSPADSSS